MPLIWRIELIILKPIRFNNCIILFPLQVVRWSRIGIHISNSMSLHFWSNARYQILVAPYWHWDSIVSYSDSGFSVHRFLAFATVDLHWSASTSFPVPNSPPSILPLQYPRPYECTMELGCDCFFVGDMISHGRDVSVTGEKKSKKKIEGTCHVPVWSCMHHRDCVTGPFFIILPPKRFISFDQYKMTKNEKLGRF